MNRPYEPIKPVDWKLEYITKSNLDDGIRFDLSTMEGVTHIETSVKGSEYFGYKVEVQFYKKIPYTTAELKKINQQYAEACDQYQKDLKVYEVWEQEQVAEVAKKKEEAEHKLYLKLKKKYD